MSRTSHLADQSGSTTARLASKRREPEEEHDAGGHDEPPCDPVVLRQIGQPEEHAGKVGHEVEQRRPQRAPVWIVVHPRDQNRFGERYGYEEPDGSRAEAQSVLLGALDEELRQMS